MTTFETAKVGDRVWSFTNGWGEIHEICIDGDRPIAVLFKNNVIETFNYVGKAYRADVNQSLFWDEVKFEIPTKPLPYLEVDTKVIVWNSSVPKTKRYFSHFSSSGEMMCFVNGMTSWTTKQTSAWDSWELAE